MADSRYKVVYRAVLTENTRDEPLWEDGCPLLVEALQVSRNRDTAQTYLQLKLLNISARTIGSVKMEVGVVSADGESERLTVKELDADIAPGREHVCRPYPLETVEPSRAYVKVIALGTDKGSWTSNGEPRPVPKPRKLDISAEAKRK